MPNSFQNSFSQEDLDRTNPNDNSNQPQSEVDDLANLVSQININPTVTGPANRDSESDSNTEKVDLLIMVASVKEGGICFSGIKVKFNIDDTIGTRTFSVDLEAESDSPKWIRLIDLNELPTGSITMSNVPEDLNIKVGSVIRVKLIRDSYVQNYLPTASEDSNEQFELLCRFQPENRAVVDPQTWVILGEWQEMIDDSYISITNLRLRTRPQPNNLWLESNGTIDDSRNVVNDTVSISRLMELSRIPNFVSGYIIHVDRVDIEMYRIDVGQNCREYRKIRFDYQGRTYKLDLTENYESYFPKINLIYDTEVMRVPEQRQNLFFKPLGEHKIYSFTMPCYLRVTLGHNSFQGKHYKFVSHIYPKKPYRVNSTQLILPNQNQSQPRIENQPEPQRLPPLNVVTPQQLLRFSQMARPGSITPYEDRFLKSETVQRKSDGYSSLSERQKPIFAEIHMKVERGL